ncbi:hypothetical protein L6E12_18255 [Actinokineospora sp. PR83]|nr:hypothetical protein [Actinokineospora sp. PR83]MCG8917726.1 hypothetical protein [Actinokineospora sp. PR83]
MQQTSIPVNSPPRMPERLGWMIGPGLPDLNRLHIQATWNLTTRRWDAYA